MSKMICWFAIMLLWLAACNPLPETPTPTQDTIPPAEQNSPTATQAVSAITVEPSATVEPPPTSPAATQASPTTAPAPPSAGLGETPSPPPPPPADSAAVPTATPTCGPPPGWDVVYTIQPGDTLFRLAIQTNTTVADIQRANCIPDPERIIAGVAILLPGRPPVTQVPTLTITVPPPPPPGDPKVDVFPLRATAGAIFTFTAHLTNTAAGDIQVMNSSNGIVVFTAPVTGNSQHQATVFFNSAGYQPAIYQARLVQDGRLLAFQAFKIDPLLTPTLTVTLSPTTTLTTTLPPPPTATPTLTPTSATPTPTFTPTAAPTATDTPTEMPTLVLPVSSEP